MILVKDAGDVCPGSGGLLPDWLGWSGAGWPPPTWHSLNLWELARADLCWSDEGRILKIYILNVHKGRQKALFFPLKKHLLRKNLKGIKNNNETKEVNIFVSLFFYLVFFSFFNQSLYVPKINLTASSYNLFLCVFIEWKVATIIRKYRLCTKNPKRI